MCIATAACFYGVDAVCGVRLCFSLAGLWLVQALRSLLHWCAPPSERDAVFLPQRLVSFVLASRVLVMRHCSKHCVSRP